MLVVLTSVVLLYPPHPKSTPWLSEKHGRSWRGRVVRPPRAAQSQGAAKWVEKLTLKIIFLAKEIFKIVKEVRDFC